MRYTMLCTLGLAFVAAGCGGTDMTTATGPDLAGAHLQSGAYNVSNIVKISDGCGLVFEGDAAQQIPALATLQLTNTGTVLSLGKMYDSTTDPKWNPPGYAGGTGGYTDSSHATLSVTTTATLADGCTYSLTRQTMATFTGQNMMSIDFTDNESNQTGCTVANGESTMACTSHYTFNLAM